MRPKQEVCKAQSVSSGGKSVPNPWNIVRAYANKFFSCYFFHFLTGLTARLSCGELMMSGLLGWVRNSSAKSSFRIYPYEMLLCATKYKKLKKNNNFGILKKNCTELYFFYDKNIVGWRNENNAKIWKSIDYGVWETLRVSFFIVLIYVCTDVYSHLFSYFPKHKKLSKWNKKLQGNHYL